MLGGRPLGMIETGLLSLAVTDCGSAANLYDRRVAASRTKGAKAELSPEESRSLEALYAIWLATEYGERDVFDCEWPDGA